MLSHLKLWLGGLLVDLPGVVAADTLGLLQLALGQLSDARQPFPAHQTQGIVLRYFYRSRRKNTKRSGVSFILSGLCVKPFFSIFRMNQSLSACEWMNGGWVNEWWMSDWIMEEWMIGVREHERMNGEWMEWWMTGGWVDELISGWIMNEWVEGGGWLDEWWMNGGMVDD